MSVTTRLNPKTEAQENQIPPQLRNWVRRNCSGVKDFRRYDTDNEGTRPGYTINARSAKIKYLPDGFECTGVQGSYTGSGVRVQIREGSL